MRALKIAGIVVLGVWMVLITWRVEHLVHVAEVTCNFAQAVYGRIEPTKIGLGREYLCPWATVIFDDREEAPSPKPNSN